LSDYCDKCEQCCPDLSEYFLDEKEMNEAGEDDTWSEYYCNQCLTERTGAPAGVFARTSGE